MFFEKVRKKYKKTPDHYWPRAPFRSNHFISCHCCVPDNLNYWDCIGWHGYCCLPDELSCLDYADLHNGWFVVGCRCANLHRRGSYSQSSSSSYSSIKYSSISYAHFLCASFFTLSEFVNPSSTPSIDISQYHTTLPSSSYSCVNS